MRIILAVLVCAIVSNITFAQRPGAFVFVRGFWAGLGLQRIALPETVRAGVLYQVPQTIFPSYRRGLENQIFPAVLEPIGVPLLPALVQVETVEAFGIPREFEHDVTGILGMVPPVQELIYFGAATSDPYMSSQTLRSGMRDITIIALGVEANLHLEAAGVMRELDYPQRLIDEQLRQAYGRMQAQLRFLAMQLDEGHDVAAVIQVIIENRDALGYVPPPSELAGRRPMRRFWGGFSGFWNRRGSR